MSRGLTGAVRPARRRSRASTVNAGPSGSTPSPPAISSTSPASHSAPELAGVDEAELAAVVEGEHVVGEAVTRLGALDDGDGAGHAEVDAEPGR